MTHLRLALGSLVILAALLVGMLPASPAGADQSEPEPLDIAHIAPDWLAALPFSAAGLPELTPADLAAFAGYDVGALRHFPALDAALGFYQFKTFVLRGAGAAAEVWVATDLQFPIGDCRGPVSITQEQVDYLLGEFDHRIYPTERDYFGPARERDGGNVALPEEYRLPPDYYAGSSRTVILIDNIRDPNFYEFPENPT